MPGLLKRKYKVAWLIAVADVEAFLKRGVRKHLHLKGEWKRAAKQGLLAYQL